MNILTVPLDSIDAGERLREIDDDYARLIAASMAEHGQMTPIEVRAIKGTKRYRLVAGAHRLRALQLAEMPEAIAVLFDGSDLQARLREIDENLVRHELTQLDRSTFLAERKAVYEALHPETKHGGNGWQAVENEQVANFATWSDVAAEKLGVSARLIRLAVLRHSRLHPDVRRRLSGTWLADHGAQLDALAKVVPSEQLRVVDLLFGDIAEDVERPDSVAEAIAAVRGVLPPAPDPVSEQFDAFLRLWRRMPAPARKRVRDFLATKEAKA